MAEGPGASRPEGHLRAGLQSAGAQRPLESTWAGPGMSPGPGAACVLLPDQGGADPHCWRPAPLLTLGSGPAALACRDVVGDPARWSGVPRPSCTWLPVLGPGSRALWSEACVSPRSLACKEHLVLSLPRPALPSPVYVSAPGGHPRGPSRTEASKPGLKWATTPGSHDCRGSGRPSSGPALSRGLGSAGPQSRGWKGAPQGGGAGEERTSSPSSKAGLLPPGIHARLPSRHGPWRAGSWGRKALTGTAPLGG